MIKPCFQHHAKRFASIAMMMLAILLVGCMGDDPPDWHGTEISGVMPKLEFDLIDSQGTRVSGDDYSGQVRMLFFGFELLSNLVYGLRRRSCLTDPVLVPHP
jgi:protein SCO1